MKAVIPAAGLGVRFLPATKAQPKEMLPVVDKPAIQYVVEEAVDSGITDIIIITGRGKRAIEDHFDKSYELEHKLREAGNSEALAQVQRIASMADIFYIRQKEQLGLGHAVLCAKKHIGDEPFAIMLGDDIILSDKPCIGQLVDVHEESGRSVVGVEQVDRSSLHKYGVIDGKKVRDGLFEVRDVVEKPSAEDAPSDMAMIGRYVFDPEIFGFLEKIGPGKGGEYQLTDAMRLMARKGHLVGLRFKGKRFDIGSKADWIKANVALSLERKELAHEVAPSIAKMVNGR